MKRFILTSLLTLFALLPLASAQDTAAAGVKIAFIQSAQVLAAHPAGQEATRLSEQARTELEQIQQSVQPLLEKRNAGQALTAEEQDTLELTQRTLQETQQRYQQELDAAAQPAEEAIDAIIQEVAAEQGYTLILNYETARSSGLVVYADPATVPDITQEVISRIEGADASAGEGETGN